jgi:hypothetical protein
MDPDDHRKPSRVGDPGRTDDVQVQAVFRHLIADIVTAVADAVRRIRGCIPDAFPGGVKMLRDGEARRHLGIGNAQEEVLIVLSRVDTSVGAILHRDDGGGILLAHGQRIGDGHMQAEASGHEGSVEPASHAFDEKETTFSGPLSITRAPWSGR